MTITTEVAIAGGDQVQMVFNGATNADVVGPHTLRVSTSADAGRNTSYTLVPRGRAVSDVSASVVPDVAGASGAAYTVGFQTSATGALVAGSGRITVAAAPGTKLPDCADVTDLATHVSADSCGGDAPPAATMTVTTEVAIAAGDQVQMVFNGATSADAVGPHSLRVSTSTDAGASTHYALVPPSGAVSDVSVGLTNPASRASGVDYKIGFRASATGALVAGSGTITVAAAPGTKLPDCAGVPDLATHASAESCAGDAPPSATMAVTTEVAIAAGDRVQMVFDGAVNASAAGAHGLRVSTSTDAGGSATYRLEAGGALEGRVVDSEHNVVPAGIVQACLSTSGPATRPRSVRPACLACSCPSAPTR